MEKIISFITQQFLSPIKPMSKTITNITFEGGGIFGIVYVGAVRVLEDQGILENITGFSGSSSGSIIAALLSFGVSVNRLEKIMAETDWNSFLDTKWSIKGIYNLIRRYGYNSGKTKEQWLKKIIGDITGKEDITFLEAYQKYNKDLHVCAINVCHETPVYFSHMTSPNLSIYHAIQMSTAFPYVFTPIKYNGCYHVDGGVMENYPIEVFPNKENSIGFKIISDGTSGHKIKNIYVFSTSILSCTLRALDDKDTIPYHDQTVFIKIPKQGLLTSVLDISDIMVNVKDYQKLGVQYTLEYLEKNEKVE